MEKSALPGPVHRFGDWIIDNFVRLPRWVRIGLWRFWHSSMVGWDREFRALRFMNYGYAPVDGAPLPIDADSTDTADERYGAHLYHVAASHIALAGRTVLEVSSGRGGGASYLARTHEPRHYIGLDISRRSVAGCRRVYGWIPNLSFVRGTAERLPFDDSTFDAVVSVEASRAYGDIDAFLREVRRVLKPDGRFLLTDMRRREYLSQLEAALADAGFIAEAAVDITPNVVRALELDSDRKVELMKRRVPGVFLSAFSEFAATVGSDRYRDFREGRIAYLSWCLRPADEQIAAG